MSSETTSSTRDTVPYRENDDQPTAEGPSGPFWNPVIRRWVGRGELDYEIYVRTSELLSLQTATEELSRQEELSFQIVHQTQELWLKLAAFECRHVEASSTRRTCGARLRGLANHARARQPARGTTRPRDAHAGASRRSAETSATARARIARLQRRPRGGRGGPMRP